MYNKLNDKQKIWILELNGAGVFSKSIELFKQHKIDAETLKQISAFWLDEHNIEGKRQIYDKEENEKRMSQSGLL